MARRPTVATSGGRWVDVTLFSRNNPALAEAQQAVPPGFLPCPLKLQAPRDGRKVPDNDDAVVEPDAERPRGVELGRRDLALKGLRALRARDDLQPPERIALDAELLRIGANLDSAALLALSAAAARDQGAHGLWLTLQTRRVATLRMDGCAAEAQEQALVVWQRVDDGIAAVELFPRMAADLCAALADTHPHLMQVIALRAIAWMQRAAARLPAEWRQNHLTRSPILQALPPHARGLLMMARPALGQDSVSA